MLQTLVLFLAAVSCQASLITLSLHNYGPTQFPDSNTQAPIGVSLELQGTPLDLTLSTGTAMPATFGSAIVAVTDPSTAQAGGFLQVPFIFDVRKDGGSVITMTYTLTLHGGPNFLAQLPSGKPVPFFDFNDGTSFAIEPDLILATSLNRVSDTLSVVPLTGKASLFTTGTGPIPEPATLWLAGVSLASGALLRRILRREA